MGVTIMRLTAHFTDIDATHTRITRWRDGHPIGSAVIKQHGVILEALVLLQAGYTLRGRYDAHVADYTRSG